MALELLTLLLMKEFIHPAYVERVKIENRKFTIRVYECGPFEFGIQSKEPWGSDKYIGGYIRYEW